MAGVDRNERQLMRQRGAGLRNVNNTDFGLNFNTHATREERQLMRQRGAGNRKVSNIDFGFSFATPNSSHRVTSNTPQTSRRRSSRVTKTSRRSSRESSVGRPFHDQSPAFNVLPSTEEQISGTSPADTSVEQPASKRRRVNRSSVELSDIHTKQRRTTSNAVFAIAEEAGTEASEEQDTNDKAQRADLNTVLTSLNDDDDKENNEVPADQDAKAPTHKAAKSVDQQPSNKRKQRMSMRSNIELVTYPTGDESIDGRNGSPQDGITAIEQPATSELELHDSHTFAKSGPVTNQRKRKRKSVVLGRKKRKSTGSDHLHSTRASSEANESEERRQTEEPRATSEDNNQEIQVSKRTVNQRHGLTRFGHPQSRRNRRDDLSIPPTSPPPDATEVEGDETYVDEENTPEPPTPAPKRKTNTKRKTQTVRQQSQSTKTSSRSTFPILTHRMTNLSALPTITEEVEGDLESNEGQLALHGNFLDRTIPNGVDVLAQICRETIETTIEDLGTEADANTQRADLKRKRSALEVFGNDLDQRLFDMSELVEHRLTLEARLRKSRREKADLQARWIELRRQRDDVALRADAVRRQNWESEHEGQQRWEISELAHRLELEVEKQEPAEESLEFLLRDVAGVVSNAGHGGGMLNRIKAFNAQLEGLALELERR